ncbi:MAG: hypothetical protein JXN63_04335 [Candidatus Delongbacteria bacterium]|nr:hypothetical protein [Candidatus Delongbacteria bacterium]
MKNFSKEQLAVFIISFAAILILVFQVISIDASTSSDDLKTRYKSSVDSVNTAEKLISYIAKDDYTYKKDVMNYKITEVKAKEVEKVVEDSKPAYTTKWVNTNDVELFGKDVISYSFYFNGKARFTINGKTQEIKVGDEIKVGKKVQQEIISETGTATGNRRTSGDYTGKVLSIGERSVYVDTGIKDKVVRYRQGVDAILFARNLMQDPNEEDKETSGTDTGGDTPTRRPGRGGR